MLNKTNRKCKNDMKWNECFDEFIYVQFVIFTIQWCKNQISLFDKIYHCINLMRSRSIKILWWYALRTWNRLKYYVKWSKKLKVDFKRFKRFDQNQFDFESISSETFFRRLISMKYQNFVFQIFHFFVLIFIEIFTIKNIINFRIRFFNYRILKLTNKNMILSKLFLYR